MTLGRAKRFSAEPVLILWVGHTSNVGRKAKMTQIAPLTLVNVLFGQLFSRLVSARGNLLVSCQVLSGQR